MEPIAELMDEHFELLDIAGNICRNLAAGKRPSERGLLELAHRLEEHVPATSPETRGMAQIDGLSGFWRSVLVSRVVGVDSLLVGDLLQVLPGRFRGRGAAAGQG